MSMRESPLDILHRLVGCEYLSDMRLKEHENRKARILLHQLNPKDFSAAQWKDTIEYLYKDV